MTEVLDHVVNRAGWSAGPWDGEPDRVQWRTAAGLPGLIVRNQMGALCGYAAVSADHPLYRVQWENIPDLHPHGGLTYSAACFGSVCHVPEPGEPDDVWWLGFDCAHLFDFIPGHYALMNQIDLPRFVNHMTLDTYKTIGFVRHEVEDLAMELIDHSGVTVDREGESQRNELVQEWWAEHRREYPELVEGIQ